MRAIHIPMLFDKFPTDDQMSALIPTITKRSFRFQGEFPKKTITSKFDMVHGTGIAWPLKLIDEWSKR